MALLVGAGSGSYRGASRRLARGHVPARSWGRARRGTVCRQDFRVGAWAGDGSVAVMTRQRTRQALRLHRKEQERERRAERSHELLLASRRRDLEHDGAPRGAIDVARREGVRDG